MTLDKTQLTNMTTRQKATAGIVVLIILIIVWQIVGLFGGDKNATPPTITTPPPTSLPSKTPSNANDTGAKNGSGMSAPQAQSAIPQPAQVNQQQMSSQQQDELIRLQQETQQKYVAALNELQMLKLSQQIAETNKSIAAAKLATVTAEKGIVDLLTTPAAPVETSASYSPGLISPGSNAPSSVPTANNASQHPTAAVNYVVISVSKLLNKWSAVLGNQGKLYSIFVGDVLPADGSSVISIDRNGVILEKDGVRSKLSLVPII
jgi:hypothetical protein